jgi:hypothetical protein
MKAKMKRMKNTCMTPLAAKRDDGGAIPGLRRTDCRLQAAQAPYRSDSSDLNETRVVNVVVAWIGDVWVAVESGEG